MYNTSQLYELSFVAPQRKLRTKPEIVFTIQLKHLEEIENRLCRVVEHIGSYASEYCQKEVSFDIFFPDLFDVGFGYERCGYVTTHDNEVQLRLPLTHGQLLCTTLTIRALTMVLAVPIEQQPSNRLQQADLETRCSNEGRGYDHAVGGYASNRLTSWLLSQVHYPLGEKAVWMPPEVIKALKYAWLAVCGTDKNRRACVRYCQGRIAPDGRFSLECVGASLAIFPDNGWREEDMVDSAHGVRVSCHNLDSAAQQLTLVAGFAKMCELAREAEN